jgi:Tfp pilus assembly protein PilF
MSTDRDLIDNASASNLHNSRGIDLAERGWFEEAIKEFKIAIERAPNSAQGYDNLGTVYADRGELLNALSSYAQALALEPENPFALHNLGCFLSNHGNSLATKCFKNAFKIDPGLYEALFNLGLCLAAEDKHEQAIAHFEEALDHNSEDREIRFHLALSLLALKRNGAAIKELLKVVTIDKLHDQAWFHLGLAYQEQGFLEEAQKAFSNAIKVDPKNIYALLSLASLLMRLERNKEAKALVKRAFHLDCKRTEDFVGNDDYLNAKP